MSGEDEPWTWPRVHVDARVVLVALGALGALLLWLALRTPEREGLGYHELGAGDGAPTVVLLHGYGAPGDDLVRFGGLVTAALPGVRVLCVEGPHDVGLGGRAWFLDEGQRAATAGRVTRFVESLVEDGTPRERIVVGGFSQGAAIAGDVGARLPGLGGVALLSGDHSTREPIRGRIFVSHGSDDAVLSFGPAAARVESYRETAAVTFVAFAGGHAIRPIEAPLIAWLRDALGM